eukprot:4934934-Pleurochrysis_carterae.AAC.1
MMGAGARPSSPPYSSSRPRRGAARARRVVSPDPVTRCLPLGITHAESTELLRPINRVDLRTIAETGRAPDVASAERAKRKYTVRQPQALKSQMETTRRSSLCGIRACKIRSGPAGAQQRDEAREHQEEVVVGQIHGELDNKEKITAFARERERT